MTIEEIAQYAFMAFVVIAVIAGLAIGYSVYDAYFPLEDADPDQITDLKEANGYVTVVMLVLGVIVGLVSITAKEVRSFLIASIALMVAGVGAGSLFPGVWNGVVEGYGVWSPFLAVEALESLYFLATAILGYIVAFAAPAAVLISIRSIWALAKEK